MQTDSAPESFDAWPTPERAPVVARPAAQRGAPPPAPVGPPPDSTPPGNNRLGWGMLFALGALALVGLGVLIAWLILHRENASTTPNAASTAAVVTSTLPAAAVAAPKIAIPDVRGLSVAAAQAQLHAQGLGATTIGVASSQPPGTVVGESPGPGARVAKGSSTKLSVAKSVPAAVPDVTGKPQAAAVQALRSAGFSAHVVTVPSSRPRGTVLAQHPSPAVTEAKGSSVRVNVAGGTTPTTAQTTTTGTGSTTSVPAVTATTLQSAVERLRGAGFLVSVAYVPGDDTLGTVEAQSPQQGASARKASHVTINASSGPGDKPQETIPDVTGGTLRQAVAGLNGAHLRLIYLKRRVTERAQAGKIVEQTPSAGAHAPQNAQVLVYLGAFEGGG